MEMNNFPLEYIADTEGRNTNNLKEFYPFVKEADGWKVDKKWYSVTHPKVKKSLEEKSAIIDLTFPHQPFSQQDAIECKKVYWAHVDSYNYDKWYFDGHPFAQKSILYKLKNSDQQILVKIGTRRFLTSGKLNESDMEDLEQLQQELNVLIDGKASFLKLSSVSPKHEVTLKATTNSLTFLDAVTWDQRCIASLEHDSDAQIVIKEWLEIDRQWEFRVFVWDGKITAISQQFIYDSFEYDIDLLKKVYFKILDSEIVSTLPYKEVTMDLYYDKTYDKIYLIECNPFGAWSAAGSALYEWKTDYEILYGASTKAPPLRLRSPIKK